MCAGLQVVGVVDESAQRGAYTQDAEVRPGDDFGIGRFGRVLRGEVDLSRMAAEHAVKHLIVGAQLAV